jgi:hypothetical protein
LFPLAGSKNTHKVGNFGAVFSNCFTASVTPGSCVPEEVLPAEVAASSFFFAFIQIHISSTPSNYEQCQISTARGGV